MNKQDVLHALALQCKCSDDSGSCTACLNYYDILAYDDTLEPEEFEIRALKLLLSGDL